MIDPEALVLVTLSLSGHERRFWDVLTAWSVTGVRLLSVQRMKNLAKLYPNFTHDVVSEYAGFAYDMAGDKRWKSLHKGSDTTTRRARIDQRREIALAAGPALMCRLRLGLGVNMRADVLCFLLASRGEAASVRQIAEALGYTNVATRRAVEDLASAQLVTVVGAARPETYSADPKAWGRVLRLSGPLPRWRGWQRLFSFLTAFGEWEKSTRGRAVSAYVLESLGNELAKDHLRIVDESGGWPMLMRTHDTFEARLHALCEWMVEYA
jgi:hypothetical protein